MPDEKKVEPEVAPSADPSEAEDRKPIEARKPEPKLTAPIKEEIQSHDTIPAWAKTIVDKLDALNAALSAEPVSLPVHSTQTGKEAAPEAEVVSEQKEEGNGKKTEKPRSRKVNLWRTF